MAAMSLLPALCCCAAGGRSRRRILIVDCRLTAAIFSFKVCPAQERMHGTATLRDFNFRSQVDDLKSRDWGHLISGLIKRSGIPGLQSLIITYSLMHNLTIGLFSGTILISSMTQCRIILLLGRPTTNHQASYIYNRT